MLALGDRHRDWDSDPLLVVVVATMAVALISGAAPSAPIALCLELQTRTLVEFPAHVLRSSPFGLGRLGV